MQKYNVTGGPLRLGPGTLIGLSPEQYASRIHNVTVVEGRKTFRLCTVDRPVEFKVGETVLLDDVLDKATAEVLTRADNGAPAKTVVANAIQATAARKATAKVSAAKAVEAANVALDKTTAALQELPADAAAEARDAAAEAVAAAQAALAKAEAELKALG